MLLGLSKNSKEEPAKATERLSGMAKTSTSPDQKTVKSSCSDSSMSPPLKSRARSMARNGPLSEFLKEKPLLPVPLIKAPKRTAMMDFMPSSILVLLSRCNPSGTSSGTKLDLIQTLDSTTPKNLVSLRKISGLKLK